jgi:hypothetical protein
MGYGVISFYRQDRLFQVRLGIKQLVKLADRIDWDYLKMLNAVASPQQPFPLALKTKSLTKEHVPYGHFLMNSAGALWVTN